jgi:hypothetical protein
MYGMRELTFSSAVGTPDHPEASPIIIQDGLPLLLTKNRGMNNVQRKTLDISGGKCYNDLPQFHQRSFSEGYK